MTEPRSPVTVAPATLIDRVRHLAGHTFGRLHVPAREWACFLPIMLLAAADRFVNLPARGIWDSDQGFEMGAIWNAVQTRQLPTFGSPAFTIGPTFHHGALFYDLMIPLSWASHGSPVAIVTEIALFGLAVVPLLWWTARSIGGTAAGLAAALLAAISPSFIANSSFVWNPVLVEPGAALACLGAWQAWKTGGPRWWIVAGAGTALASQSHLTGLALVFPMAILFLLALRRSPSGARRRMLGWGLAGVGLFLLSWAPWIVSELTHGFAETKAILSFSQGSPPGADPFSRLFISTIRILAWPLTRWPLVGVPSGFVIALTVSVALILGLVWRITGLLASSRVVEGAANSGAANSGAAEPGAAASATRVFERQGLLFVCGSIALLTAILGLGIKEISQFADDINQEQYHSVVDVFVVLAAGLLIGGIWRAMPWRGHPRSGHVLASGLLIALVVVGVAYWPPLTAPDGGWPAAQKAATHIEGESGGKQLALVALPTFIPADAYGYPLKLDGYELVGPAGAGTLVTLCYPSWAAKWSLGSCGGEAEAGWISANLPGATFTRVDSWMPAPDRVLSVYRRN